MLAMQHQRSRPCLVLLATLLATAVQELHCCELHLGFEVLFDFNMTCGSFPRITLDMFRLYFASHIRASGAHKCVVRYVPLQQPMSMMALFGMFSTGSAPVLLEWYNAKVLASRSAETRRHLHLSDNCESLACNSRCNCTTNATSEVPSP